jgi:hypothetical protein
VSHGHQGKGLGKALTEAITERTPVLASLSQTDAAWKVFQKSGWHPRQTAKLYLCPLPMIPGAMPLLRSVLPTAPALRMEVAAISGPTDPELDALWNELRDSFDALVVRDARQLWSRYGMRQDRGYRIIRACRDNRLCAYMIVRVCPPNSLRSLKRYPMGRHPLGLIVDYLVQPDEPRVFAALLDEAGRTLAARGARSILCLSTVPAFHRPLVVRGYLHGGTPLLARKLSSMNVGFTFFTKPGERELAERRWFLTLGDCDMDLTWGESPV